MFHIGYENGERFMRKEKFAPVMYVPCKPEKEEYRSMDGIPLASFVIGDMKETRDYLKHMPSNMKLFGHEDFSVQYINENYDHTQVYADMSKVNVCYMDIEVMSDDGFPEPKQAKHMITAITLLMSNVDKYYVFAMGEWDRSKSVVPKELDIEYIWCEDEEDMLNKFLTVWANNYPDIVTGWNSEEFDMAYIVNRIINVLGDKAANKLSPWKIKPMLIDRYEYRYKIYGITQMDYMLLYKKLNREKQESYALGFIGNVEVGEKKTDYSEYGSLHNLYTNNHQLYIDYNIQDTYLVKRIDEKKAFIPLCMTVAYMTGQTFDKTFGQRNKPSLGTVNIWEAYIYNFMKKRGQIIDPKKSNHKEEIVGGYVKHAEIGKHKWLMSFDLNSLYPHLMMQYNVSPDTIVNHIVPNVDVDDILNGKIYDIPEGMSMAATGQCFDATKRGMFPEIVHDMYNNVRKTAKDKMLEHEIELQQCYSPTRKKELDGLISVYDGKQYAIKILMNSLYGATANEWFRYYDPRVAEAITMSGQLSIRWAEKVMNSYLKKKYDPLTDYVIAMDTDSLYIKIDQIVEKQEGDKLEFIINDIVPRLEALIEKGYVELAKRMKAENFMVMKLEVIADAALWSAKKKYALQVLHKEGVTYKKPVLKIVGIEAIRKSTPEKMRALIRHTIRIILNKEQKDLQAFVLKAREEFDKLSVEEISFPRGVGSIKKYVEGNSYAKGCPINSRGSILHNQLVKEHHLTDKVEKIKESDKIKYCYLKLPNPINENVIAYKGELPKEFGLHEYVNYNMMFEKTYTDAIDTILKPIGWTTEKVNTLEEFFS